MERKLNYKSWNIVPNCNVSSRNVIGLLYLSIYIIPDLRNMEKFDQILNSFRSFNRYQIKTWWYKTGYVDSDWGVIKIIEKVLFGNWIYKYFSSCEWGSIVEVFKTQHEIQFKGINNGFEDNNVTDYINI